MSNLDLQSIKSQRSGKNRYQRRMAHLSGQGMVVDSIEKVVEESLENIKNGFGDFDLIICD